MTSHRECPYLRGLTTRTNPVLLIINWSQTLQVLCLLPSIDDPRSLDRHKLPLVDIAEAELSAWMAGNKLRWVVAGAAAHAASAVRCSVHFRLSILVGRHQTHDPKLLLLLLLHSATTAFSLGQILLEIDKVKLRKKQENRDRQLESGRSRDRNTQ